MLSVTSGCRNAKKYYTKDKNNVDKNKPGNSGQGQGNKTKTPKKNPRRVQNKNKKPGKK